MLKFRVVTEDQAKSEDETLRITAPIDATIAGDKVGMGCYLQGYEQGVRDACERMVTYAANREATEGQLQSSSSKIEHKFATDIRVTLWAELRRAISTLHFWGDK